MITKLYTYQRPNGHNEFNEYLATLDALAVKAIKATVKKIETNGNIVSLHQSWIRRLRNTGIFEIRTQVERNQYRGYMIPIHRQADYVILTGRTKKNDAVTTQLFDQLKALRKEFNDLKKPTLEAIDYPKHPVETAVEDDQPTIPLTEMGQRILEQLHRRFQFKTYNQLDQKLHLAPKSIEKLLTSPVITALPKIKARLTGTYNELFEYQAHWRLVPEAPLVKQIQNQVTTNRQTKFCYQVGISDVSSLADQNDYKTLYTIVLKLACDFDHLFADSNAVVVEPEIADPDTVKQLLLQVELNQTKFTKNLGLPSKSISNLLRRDTFQHLLDIKQTFGGTIDEFVGFKPLGKYYHVLPKLQRLLKNQTALQKYIKAHHIVEPTKVGTIKKLFKSNVMLAALVLANLFAVSLDQLVVGHHLDVTTAKYHYQLALHGDDYVVDHKTLADEVQSQTTPADNAIESNTAMATAFASAVQNSVERSAEQVESSTPTSPLATYEAVKSQIKTAAPKSKTSPHEPNRPESKHLDSATDDALVDELAALSNPSKPQLDSRLQRLFAKIEQLTPNQLLIINDLINSWR